MQSIGSGSDPVLPRSGAAQPLDNGRVAASIIVHEIAQANFPGLTGRLLPLERPVLAHTLCFFVGTPIASQANSCFHQRAGDVALG